MTAIKDKYIHVGHKYFKVTYSILRLHLLPGPGADRRLLTLGILGLLNIHSILTK